MLDRRVKSFTDKKEASMKSGRNDDRAKIFMGVVKQNRHRQNRDSEGNRFGRDGDNKKSRAFRFKFHIHGRRKIGEKFYQTVHEFISSNEIEVASIREGVIVNVLKIVATGRVQF